MIKSTVVLWTIPKFQRRIAVLLITNNTLKYNAFECIVVHDNYHFIKQKHHTYRKILNIAELVMNNHKVFEDDL